MSNLTDQKNGQILRSISSKYCHVQFSFKVFGKMTKKRDYLKNNNL